MDVAVAGVVVDSVLVAINEGMLNMVVSAFVEVCERRKLGVIDC